MAPEEPPNTLQIGDIIRNSVPSNHAIDSVTAQEIRLGIEAQGRAEVATKTQESGSALYAAKKHVGPPTIQKKR
jgi:hypothetical protein